MSRQISTFAINLQRRTDRKHHIVKQFKEKRGFDLAVVNAIEDKIGAIGLWKTIRKIIKDVQEKEYPFILICEDDHLFTDSFDYDRLIYSIDQAKLLEADLLLGGLSNFDDGIPLSNGMFWVSAFTGFHFVIVFEKFYSQILSLQLYPHENIDIKMGALSTNIFCMYPFISIQKEFGYSDVTSRNGTRGVVSKYFENVEKRMDILIYLKKHFTNFS